MPAGKVAEALLDLSDQPGVPTSEESQHSLLEGLAIVVYLVVEVLFVFNICNSLESLINAQVNSF